MYKLIFADEQNLKLCKTYFGEGVIGEFLYDMMADSKYCRRVIVKEFNILLLFTKKDYEDFEKSIKCVKHVKKHLKMVMLK